jgi:hypothetical protein
MRREHKLSPVSDERMVEEKDFLESARGQMEALEVIREQKLVKYSFRKSIAIPAAVVLTPVLAHADYWLLFFQRGNDDSAAGLSIAFLGALYWWVTKPRREYAKAYKQEILPSLAKLFGNFTYNVDGRVPMHSMRSSKIVPRHDKYESEDYFMGEYMGVRIQFSEVDLKQKRRSKNRTHYVSVFQGLAVLLDMKSKRFLGHTIIDHNKSKISEWFKERSLDLKRANLVDPVFEDRFDVYTNDQVEARYLVDPTMIERLNGMYEEYNGNKMAAAFYDSKMLILIASKHNYFEPAQLEIPATDPRSILSMKKEIGEILSIVERLELYDPYEVRAQGEVLSQEDPSAA